MSALSHIEVQVDLSFISVLNSYQLIGPNAYIHLINGKSMSAESQFITDKSLATRYQVSRATIWRWARTNQIPRPIKLNNATRWRLSDLQEWEEAQSDQRS